jgi:hypothetical protein
MKRAPELVLPGVDMRNLLVLDDFHELYVSLFPSNPRED